MTPPVSINSVAKKLGDLGEFRLLKEVVFPMLEKSGASVSLGDDCSSIPLPDSDLSLLVTSDFAPQPLVWQLGAESYETWGWYAVLINASDLAAAGAHPMAFASSVEAPSSLAVQNFEGFFSGMGSACKEFVLPNAGGNIREAPHFECHGMALGLCKTSAILTRKGCLPGDSIFVVGSCGLFISSYLRAYRNGMESLNGKDHERLFRPRAKLREMAVLQKSGLLRAASDNSDGVLGTLWNIAEGSLCGIEVDLNERLVPAYVREVAKAERLDPWNLMFFWGDWQIVVAVGPGAILEFQRVIEKHSIDYMRLGTAIEGPPALWGVREGVRYRLNLLRNENFTSSGFNSDVGAQLEYMLHTPVLAEKD